MVRNVIQQSKDIESTLAQFSSVSVISASCCGSLPDMLIAICSIGQPVDGLLDHNFVVVVGVVVLGKIEVVDWHPWVKPKNAQEKRIIRKLFMSCS